MEDEFKNENNKTEEIQETTENINVEINEDIDTKDIEVNEEMTAVLPVKSENSVLRKLMDKNYIEYASYVIKDRAIPDVDDGLKPVQRRILWSLFRIDDGKFHKVANVIGHTMQFHPHGDASIGAALVVLANKEFYIEKQGNFGNILTGDSASAARYIECRLTPLSRNILFNNDITEFIDSYDGRNREPVRLPIKIPSLLMLGAKGIAVGMSTNIFPHNFKELLEAQISILRKEPFEILPDFPQGGTMDASEYEQGRGKIRVRAKIERDKRKIIIKELPFGTTTESLIASIEKANEKNKIKIASVDDYTTENVEIEILPMRGYDVDQAIKALYAYTDCSMSLSSNLMVIKENHPVQMTVNEILQRNTYKMLEYLRRELELDAESLMEKFHQKTLAQIFIENRIYKRIEECDSDEQVMSEVRIGLELFKHLIHRDITDDDIKKLLEIPIKRISRFDINKNRKDLDDILTQLKQIQKNLKRLKSFAIKYVQNIIDKYAKNCVRKTEIETFDVVDKTQVALDNLKVGWNKQDNFVGTSVRSDDPIKCNEYDNLLCIERNGKYKIINVIDKVFVGKLCHFSKYDKSVEFGIIYTDKKTKKVYAKRTVIDKFITDKEYVLCPQNCKLEVITHRSNSKYDCIVNTKKTDKQHLTIDLLEFPERTPKARGLLVSDKEIKKITFAGLSERIEEGDNEKNESKPNIDIEDINENTIQDEENNDVSIKFIYKDDIANEVQLAKEKAEEFEVFFEKVETSYKERPNLKPADSAKEEKPANSAKEEKPANSAKEEKPAEVAKPKKQQTIPKKSKDNNLNDNDDDWGIVQTEFDF